MSRLPLLIAGTLLVLAGAFWNNSGIESAFGRDIGSLAWGPTLFRVLLVLHGVVLIALTRLQSKRVSRPTTRNTAAWWTLSAITLVALALRLWKLNTGLWFDEVTALVDFVRPSAGIIFTSFPNQNQHMLFSLLAHAAVGVFGEHAWSLRLPAVLFGVGSIWALFLLGRRVLGAREALFACALMAVSYHHIWFSQNARGYTGLLFFSILAVWLWLEALERRSTGWSIAFAASIALGIWAHLTMVFVVAGIGVVYLAGLLRRDSLERSAGWGPWLGFALGGTLALQFHALALPEFLRTALHEVSLPSEWTNPLWVVTESLRSLHVGLLGSGVLICGAAFMLFGWLRLMLRDARAVAIMTVPAVLGGAMMMASSHNLWPRFFFFSMGFALLIVIGGVMESAMVLRARPSWALAACGVIVLVSALTVPRVFSLPKQDFIGARDYAERLRTPENAIVAIGLAGVAYEKYYAPQWAIAKSGEELETLRQRYPDLALVYTLPIELKAFHPDVWRVVEERFETVATFPGTLGGGEVFVCRQRSNVALRKQ